LFVTDNSYDDRGSRPVHEVGDLLWAKLEPIGPVGRMLLYTMAVIVMLSVVWVLLGSSLLGLFLALRPAPGS
jgi:hypothetical protein